MGSFESLRPVLWHDGYDILPEVRKTANNISETLNEWGFPFAGKVNGQHVDFILNPDKNFTHKTFEHLMTRCAEHAVTVSYNEDTNIIKMTPIIN